MAELTKKELEEVLNEKFEEQAQLIARSFAVVDERFDTIDERLNKIDGRFDKVEGDINEVKDSLRVIEAKVNKALNIEYVRLEKRLKVVEQKLGIVVPKEA